MVLFWPWLAQSLGLPLDLRAECVCVLCVCVVCCVCVCVCVSVLIVCVRPYRVCAFSAQDDYEVFRPFFQAALEKYHKVDLSKKQHTNNWDLKGIEGLPEDGQLDLTKLGLPALSMRVRTGRNLSKSERLASYAPPHAHALDTSEPCVSDPSGTVFVLY
jgi:hypothetical protein